MHDAHVDTAIKDDYDTTDFYNKLSDPAHKMMNIGDTIKSSCQWICNVLTLQSFIQNIFIASDNAHTHVCHYSGRLKVSFKTFSHKFLAQGTKAIYAALRNYCGIIDYFLKDVGPTRVMDHMLILGQGLRKDSQIGLILRSLTLSRNTSVW